MKDAYPHNENATFLRKLLVDTIPKIFQNTTSMEDKEVF